MRSANAFWCGCLAIGRMLVFPSAGRIPIMRQEG
jgi:hypothetical protein